jgi:choline dehydrogenase-like flavoprotein
MTVRRIIIVGSGVAAAQVATRLLSRDKSLSILMLEAGPDIVMRDRRKWQDMVTAGSDPYEANKETDADAGIIPPNMTVVGMRLFGRGGTTAHWGGSSFRLKPEDFFLHTNAGREIDWPFGYDTLEPYYHEAEHALGVEGDSADDDPPRRGKKYPLEALPFVALDGPVVTAFEASGISYGHVPMARSSNCVTTGTCIYCPVGGKYSADLTLGTFWDEHRFELRLNAPVLRVLLHNKRSASGVEYVDTAAGKHHREPADEVIICAGAFESPKLLLASAEPRWPHGLGNDSGHVGIHPKWHHRLLVTGTLANNLRRLRHELDIPTLCTRHFDTAKEQRLGKFYITNLGTQEFPRPLNELLQGGASAGEIDALGQGPVSFTLIGSQEHFSNDGDFVRLAPGTNRFGLPRMEVRVTEFEDGRTRSNLAAAQMARVLEAMGAHGIRTSFEIGTSHFAGATRMAKQGSDGVVDENLAIHGMDNVHLCSNSVFPSIGSVNPTLTLVALAIRLGDQLCS